MNKSAKKPAASYTDEELFREIAQGQTWAFSIVYDRYSPQLYGLALKILQNQTLAEDVIQDVFVNVWKKAKTFDQKRGVAAGWLSILCRNKCIDVLRSKEGRKRTTPLDEYVAEKVLIDPVDDPLKQTDAAQVNSFMKTAMGNLPDEQKLLIEMAYFKGYSQSEISKELKQPLGTVKTRIRLGMQKLRDALTEKLNT